MRSHLALVFVLLMVVQSKAQFTCAKAVSFQDNQNNIPLLAAYYANFGLVELDLWLDKGNLLVGKDANSLTPESSLENTYLQPLAKLFKQNGNRSWKDRDGNLMLIVNLKNSPEAALPVLSKLLEPYKAVFDIQTNKNACQLVVGGDGLSFDDFGKAPSFLWLNASEKQNYTTEQLKRVAFFTINIKSYTIWKGKSGLTRKDEPRLRHLVDSVHSIGSKVRFTNTPDNPNGWKVLMNLGADFVNSSKISSFSDYLNKRAKNEYTAIEQSEIYTPTYKSDDKTGKVKNIILMVGDGMGLTQTYAGFTANGGKLSLYNFRNIGFSKTYSADSYITDSAAGATAFSTGHKTDNLHLGVDSIDKPMTLITEILHPWGIKSGLVTVDYATGATPAAFYAHVINRDLTEEIAANFVKSDVDILMGGNPKAFETREDGRNLFNELRSEGYEVLNDLTKLDQLKTNKAVLIDDHIHDSKIDGRRDILKDMTAKTIELLNRNPKGFFMMVEGAQIDFGGHLNNVQYVAREMIDFDKAVAEALKFADKDGETLVIVTADHETGGLSLLDGSFKKGMVDGSFSTDDHTSVMVPVYAYGPHALDFRGIYENTEIFSKVLAIFTKYSKSPSKGSTKQ